MNFSEKNQFFSICFQKVGFQRIYIFDEKKSHNDEEMKPGREHKQVKSARESPNIVVITSINHHRVSDNTFSLYDQVPLNSIINFL